MSSVNVESVLKQAEALLARAGVLPVEADEGVEKLLNVVEALCVDKNELSEEVQRLRKQLEQKKKDKTTAAGKPDDDQAAPRHSNHSSERQRRQRDQKRRAARFTRQVYYSAREQRFFRGALPEGYDQGDEQESGSFDTFHCDFRG